MSLLNRLFVGHKLDDWAGEQTLFAARTLNQVAADLIAGSEKELTEARLQDALFWQDAFINDHIAPKLRSVAEPVAISILEHANATLLELVEHQAVWVRSPEHSVEAERTLEGATDVALAAAPLAAGVAAAAALPFAAVSTTTAWLGLVTVTTISWPVVVGGSALAALGVATGAFNTAKIRDKAMHRLRRRVRDFITMSLLTGSEQGSSILNQLAMEFDRVAREARAL